MSLENHEEDYLKDSWKQYSMLELGNAVNHFSKRAFHRDNDEKMTKDMYDAKNYLLMMQIKLKNRCEKLGIDFESL